MKTLFNDNWMFKKYSIDTPEEEYLNADKITSPIDVPHDWLIYNTNDLYEDSIGCYKKEFSLNDIDGKRFFIMFDGVYMDSYVYVNGSFMGNWKYGYTAFEYEITDYIHNGVNTILVAVVHKSPNSRWYSGAGIYRNVWLRTTKEQCLKSGGIYVASQPEDDKWKVEIDAEVDSKEDIKNLVIENYIYDKEGNQCGYCKGIVGETQSILLENTTRWSIENPYLYTLITKLVKDNICIDQESQKIGLRTIRFDNNKGFFLNEKHVKIHGVCEHHDLGAIGAAFNLTALRRKFEKLQLMGVNSIRTSHNPPAREFCELADEMGILINSEIFDMWESPKTEFDYGNYFNDCWEQDVDSWIRRDRNHPCIIMWSIGNEIYDAHHGRGLEITRNLRDRVMLNDPKHNAWITMGSNYMEWEGAQNCMDELELAGYNYGERLYDDHHSKHPHWCIYGSETSSTVQSRGIYHFPADNFILTHRDEQCSALGNGTTNWSARNSQEVVIKDRDFEFSAGQFIWTGFDYIGEPTPYFNKNSYFGQLDTAGFEKDSYYVYQAEWTDYKTAPMVHILPYWNYNEGQLIDIKIYSNCPKVELFLNNVSQGEFSIDHKKGKELAACYRIPYEDGTIKAVAYGDNGEILAEASKSTFGDATQIVLKPDKTEFNADGTDMIFVEISMTDEQGIPVDNANNRCEVIVSGAGRLVGLDNGDSTDYDQYKGTNKRLFSGKLLAMIAAGNTAGEVKVLVKSKGFENAELKLTALPAGTHITKIEENVNTYCDDEIPVRQIKLKKSGSCILSPQNKSIKLEAEIFPKNATLRDLEWMPVSLDGIESNAAQVRDGIVTAKGDGTFRLCCSAYNGTNHPEIISEYEFEVNDMGETSLDPYKLVPAVQRSLESQKNKVSFLGGVFITGGRNWVSFDRVDFGDYGSDEITLPIFSFSTTLPLEIWEGTPGDGKLLLECEYNSPSWYNHYQENTFKLPYRLKGMQTISIVAISEDSFSLQGFYFKKYEKAYSQIDAGDHINICGDAFNVESDAITGIGNNVSIEFGTMDFSSSEINCITVCGRSSIDLNSIHLLFKNEDESIKRIVEFTRDGGMETENGYRIQKINFSPLKGKYSVSFIFLPGSKFDLKWFKFSGDIKNLNDTEK